MAAPITGHRILEMIGGFREACIIGAAAELDLWNTFADKSYTADELCTKIGSDLRGTSTLLDAMVPLGLLEKEGDRYHVPSAVLPLLTDNSDTTVLPMVRHSMCILRQWAQLAWTAKSGIPAPRQASIRGFEADRAAFIGAMHSVSNPMADGLVAQLAPFQFKQLLDVGGASGTWTLAFLRAMPGIHATIFDLPDAIKQAVDRFKGSEFLSRINFVGGDFYKDDLPGGCDFAWVSAIVHQHGREENRALFAKIYKALVPGSTIAIRDMVMEPCRTKPVAGTQFAINMLVNTDSGGTFTFEELAEDLKASGFIAPRRAVTHEAMNSVVVASKPEKKAF